MKLSEFLSAPWPVSLGQSHSVRQSRSARSTKTTDKGEARYQDPAPTDAPQKRLSKRWYDHRIWLGASIITGLLTWLASSRHPPYADQHQQSEPIAQGQSPLAEQLALTAQSKSISVDEQPNSFEQTWSENELRMLLEGSASVGQGQLSPPSPTDDPIAASNAASLIGAAIYAFKMVDALKLTIATVRPADPVEIKKCENLIIRMRVAGIATGYAGTCATKDFGISNAKIQKLGQSVAERLEYERPHLRQLDARSLWISMKNLDSLLEKSAAPRPPSFAFVVNSLKLQEQRSVGHSEP